MKHKKKFGNQKVEECGIWLDTAELKRRKMEPRSILKQLNPLSRSKYNIEVALNFTQTRAPQQCAKQTTVPSFFFPKSKGKPANPPHTPTPGAVSAASPVSGKNVTEGETCTGQPELIREEDFRSAGSGRRALVDQQERLPTTLRAVRCSSEESDPSPGATLGNTTLALNEQRYRPSEQGQQCPRKDGAGVDTVARELLPAHSTTAGEASTSSGALSAPPDRFTQLDFTQDSQGNHVMSHGKSTSSPAVNHAPDKGTPVAEGKADDWPGAESKILCTKSFEAALCRPLTSTQRTTNRERGLSERKMVRSPEKLNSTWGKGSFPENKENVCGPTVLLSTRKEVNLNPTPLKGPLQPSGTTSPLHPRSAGSLASKRPKKPRDDQSALSLLFSQDSQGNRVISHRRTDRSFPECWGLPLSRCTNAISRGNGCSAPPNVKLPLLCKSSCPVESKYDNTFSPQADLLFTQDSEGNAVIKHC